jgi:hypothetical protein
VLNTFFVNNLDPDRFPKTRLWLDGHAHNPFDYVVSADDDHAIRVVCNALCYPITQCEGRAGAMVIELSQRHNP